MCLLPVDNSLMSSAQFIDPVCVCVYYYYILTCELNLCILDNEAVVIDHYCVQKCFLKKERLF